MRYCFLSFVFIVSLSAADPTVTRGDGAVTADLGNGTTLTFATSGDLLLGLNRAAVDGVELTSADTVQRPLVCAEFGEGRFIASGLKLMEAVVVDGRLELRCELLGPGDDAAWRQAFVYGGDMEAAMKNLPVALGPAGMMAEAGRKRLLELLETTDAMRKLRAEEAEHLAVVADESASKDAIKKAKRWLRDLEKKNLQRTRDKALPGLLAANEEAAEAQQAIDTFRLAVQAVAVARFGRIHRDHYRFAVTRLPAEICTLEAVRAVRQEDGVFLGTLVWVFEPVERSIAGWPWKGWSSRYRLALADGRKVNCLRQLGTWELGGTLDGLTAVALRYRGLGRIEQAFTLDEAGGAREAWTTTEIIPGAAGGGYAVSPVVPSSKEKLDRGYALQHRVGAWIAKPARGAGAPLVDFQCRPHAAFFSSFDRQACLRAVSEVMPGDTVLSQTDEEFFPLTDAHETTPQLYLALVDREQPFTVEELRTRWMEVDADVRRRVCDELGFVEYPVLPGVGVIASGQPQNIYQSATDAVLDAWQRDGVRIVASHSPGWINREIWRDGKMLPAHTNGGECSINDWRPSPPVSPVWQAFMGRAAKHGIAYYPWLGMTIISDSPFAKRVGDEKRHWSLNTPDDEYGPGYEPMHVKGNRFDPDFCREYDRCLEETFADHGFQGFWIDSFQNLMMSQLAWSDGSGASMQRAWWEWLAAWSKRGVATMGESHAVPGISCSIEVADWEQDLWYFRQVWKWYRGGSMERYTPEQLEDQAYGCKADLGLPRFGEFANAYLAALPQMDRPYVLPGGKGVLWLDAEDVSKGVLYCFEEMPVPGGTNGALPVGADESAVEKKTLGRHRVYFVREFDLLGTFGVRPPPGKDGRDGTERVLPNYTWPDWAKAEGKPE